MISIFHSKMSGLTRVLLVKTQVVILKAPWCVYATVKKSCVVKTQLL